VGPWAQQTVTVLFDGACSVCKWEVDMLKARQADLGGSSLLFVDTAAEDYDASTWAGIDAVTAAGLEGQGIHGLLPSGEVIYGIPVFKLIYEELGWGWLFAAHGVPVLRELIEVGYYLFAVNRLKITGRWADDEELRRALAARASGAEACERCSAGGGLS